MAIFAPWLMFAIISRKAVGLPRHLHADVEAFFHSQLFLHFSERLLTGIDGERDAHFLGEFEAIGFMSVMTT